MKRRSSMIGPQYVEPVWLWTERIDGAANGSASRKEEGNRVMQPVELENKVALIVGGASEQGESLAISFAERGMHVAIIFDDDDEERARTVKKNVEKMGRRCVLIRGDGGETQDEDMFARKAVEQVLEKLGRLDVFINVSERQFPVEALNGDGSKTGASGSPELFRDFQILKAALDEIVG